MHPHSAVKSQKMKSDGEIKHVLLLENDAGTFSLCESQETTTNISLSEDVNQLLCTLHSGHPTILTLNIN